MSGGWLDHSRMTVYLADHLTWWLDLPEKFPKLKGKTTNKTRIITGNANV
jgi:hypothetical protein